jgi:hypothetical protein
MIKIIYFVCIIVDETCVRYMIYSLVGFYFFAIIKDVFLSPLIHIELYLEVVSLDSVAKLFSETVGFIVILGLVRTSKRLKVRRIVAL